MDAHPTDRENPLEKDFRQIIERGDAAALRELIDRHPETHPMLDQPWFAFGAPAIVLAASRADRELIRALLDAGADLDRLLADAAWMGRTEAVRTMLELGFDPAVPGDHDSTPLDRASFHGLVAIVALLLEHDPEPPLERKNAFGGTPLDAPGRPGLRVGARLAHRRRLPGRCATPAGGGCTHLAGDGAERAARRGGGLARLSRLTGRPSRERPCVPP